MCLWHILAPSAAAKAAFSMHALVRIRRRLFVSQDEISCDTKKTAALSFEHT